MFLDMRSSTTIAERLGHIKYSQLVQDCFQDIGVVVDFKAEIYQYVGDEAVLTWESSKGLMDANCIHAFTAFSHQLSSRTAYYMDKYGLVPEFKAGINIGTVTVAEVGDVKREIAFHGDTINTAARIQSKCNEFGKDLLVSSFLVDRLPQEFIEQVETSEVGEVMLRGKRQSVKIFAVSQ